MIINEPLSRKAINRKQDEHGYVQITVPVPLNTLIDLDREAFNEYIGERIFEGTLRDITYRVAGYTFNGSDNDGEALESQLLIEVHGQVVNEEEGDTDWFYRGE